MKRSTFITWDQLKVGTLILIGLTVLGFAGYYLGKAAHLFSKRYTLVAFVPNANGLRAGGSVLVAGQLAGSIKAIDFLPVDADTARKLSSVGLTVTPPTVAPRTRSDRLIRRPSCVPRNS